jgi:hypothetical protein
LYATTTLQAALSHSSDSSAPTQSVFLAEAQPLEDYSPYGGVAETLAGQSLQKAAPLRDGGRRVLVYVLFEKLLRDLVHLLGGLPPPLLGLRESPGLAIRA